MLRVKFVALQLNGKFSTREWRCEFANAFSGRGREIVPLIYSVQNSSPG